MINTELSPNAVKIFKECFSKITIEELSNRINYFREFIQLRDISEEYLKKELRKLFAIDLNGISSTFFLKSDTLTNEYQRFHFYRVRKFTEEDKKEIYTKNFLSMQKESDIWMRPANDVKYYGRLNRPKESILYLGATATNSIYETGCKPGDFFFLQVYRNKRRMRVSQIHTVQYMNEFSELENAKRTILHNFLLSEFTKSVPSNKEYLYKSSLLIYEEFFKSELIDAFCYPSVKTENRLGYNIVFDEKRAKENLTFLGVMVCRLSNKPIDAEFGMEHFYDGFLNDKGSFDFFRGNSDISREKFGDFVRIRDMGL